MKLAINLILISIIFFFAGCDTTPYVDDYTRHRPSFVDVVGIYQYEQETIHESDTIHYPATIVLKADGKFEAHGIPDLVNDGKSHYDKDSLISSSGEWKIEVDSVTTAWRKKIPHWGIKLTSMPESLSFVGFMGDAPPYKMIVNYDDIDLGQVMIFSKR